MIDDGMFNGLASQVSLLEARLKVLEAKTPDDCRKACCEVVRQVAAQWGKSGDCVVNAILDVLEGPSG